MPDIRHELLIGASPEKVFESITTQEGLAAWWTPNAKAKSIRDSIARFPFGENYFKEMKVVELTSPQTVKWACVAGAEEWVGTDISFTLQPFDKRNLLNLHPEVKDQMQQQERDTGTLLIFHHDHWKEYTPMFAECNYTWGRFLRSLKILCETGKGRPWPGQHRI